MIRYVTHNEINKEKWDHCISGAYNRSEDVRAWYLDIMCPGWTALVLGDYEVVMPLPVKRKLGFTYVYKPLFIQQLGIIGKNISPAILHTFLNAIPESVKLADIMLNEGNQPLQSEFKLIRNQNYKLNIQNSYEKIQHHYHRNCQRNIKKALDGGLKFIPSLSIDRFTGLLEKQLEDQIRTFKNKEKSFLRTLIQESINRKSGEIVGVQDNTGNLAAAAFYLFSFERLMFKICGSSPEGKNKQAMYLLVDEQIKRYSGKFAWYDFQGSNINGIAYFNSTFGALPSTYYSLRLNRLPFLIRWVSGKK